VGTGFRWFRYNGLVDLGYGDYRVNHSKDEFVVVHENGNRAHINGIEGFWGMAKVRLAKFKGLPKHTFQIHLKETEWRYNNRAVDKTKILLKFLRNKPLF
jgi:transposase